MFRDAQRRRGCNSFFLPPLAYHCHFAHSAIPSAHLYLMFSRSAALPQSTVAGNSLSPHQTTAGVLFWEGEWGKEKNATVMILLVVGASAWPSKKADHEQSGDCSMGISCAAYCANVASLRVHTWHAGTTGFRWVYSEWQVSAKHQSPSSTRSVTTVHTKDICVPCYHTSLRIDGRHLHIWWISSIISRPERSSGRPSKRVAQCVAYSKMWVITGTIPQGY